MTPWPPEVEAAWLELLWQEILGQAHSPDYIAWGTTALSLGLDTPALRRLAADYAQDNLNFEVLPTYRRALQELGRDLPTPSETGKRLTVWLVEQILAGEREPETGLEMLAKLYVAQDYSAELSWFSDLQEAQELKASGLGEFRYLYPELAQRPLGECLREECELFLAYRELEIPSHLYHSVHCRACGHLGPPAPRPRPDSWKARLLRWWRGGPQVLVNRCARCRGTELLYLSSLEGRHWYLQHQSGAHPESQA